jgi:NADH-quinone oxidoreductase subunit A
MLSESFLLLTQVSRAPAQVPAKTTTIPAPPIYGYIPIIIFLLIAIAFDRAKLMPYECGIDPVGDARERFSVRFYMVAMLFLIFDVETIFLFPWAIIYDRLAIFGLAEMLVFIGILVVGYYYAWQKGAFEWA